MTSVPEGRDDAGMTRETVEQILADRKATKDDRGYEVPAGEVATALLGAGQLHAVPGVVRFGFRPDALVLTSRKGSETYVDYDALRALTFESKEVADRRTGF